MSENNLLIYSKSVTYRMITTSLNNENNMCWSKMCSSTPEQSQKLLKDTVWSWSDKCHYPQENVSFTDMGWKATQQGGSHYTKNKYKN